MKKIRKKILFSFLIACLCSSYFLYSTNLNDHRDTLLLEACEKGNKEQVELLLEKGANIEAKDENGETPLMVACREAYKEMVKLLIEKGANIEIKDKDGNTPLLWACEEGNKEIVELLLVNGANIEAKDNFGWTPLMCACLGAYKEIVKLLLENGADIEAKNDNGKISLRFACELGNKEIVELLLEKGANIEVKDEYGRTPLLWACKEGNKEIVELLLVNGANIEVKDDNEGWTPLLWICYKGNKEIVKLLLEKGANIEVKDEYGRTALDYMLEDNNTKFARILIEHGADICNLYKSKNAEQFETACKQYAQLNAEIEELKKNISVNKINNLMLDPQTPLFAKQSALAYLSKTPKSLSDKMTKSMLLSYYKKISFNYRFFNDKEFKQAIEFAIKENAKDRFGRSVFAVALLDRRNKYRDRLISKLAETTYSGESLQGYLAQESDKKEKQTPEFLMEFARCVDTLQYLEYGSKGDKRTLPPEIAARIMSYMKL